MKRKEKKKIDKARKRGYIVTKFVGITRSFMHFVSVPKGDDDIRMVYDGSRSGLNQVLWAPWLALPTVTSMCCIIDAGYWCVDNDFGEMNLNFWLHPDLREYCGVDISHLYPEEWSELKLAPFAERGLSIRRSRSPSKRSPVRLRFIEAEAKLTPS